MDHEFCVAFAHAHWAPQNRAPLTFFASAFPLLSRGRSEFSVFSTKYRGEGGKRRRAEAEKVFARTRQGMGEDHSRAAHSSIVY